MHKGKTGTILSALQWLLFHVGVVLSVPIIVGNGFQLGPGGVENLMRLTFFITGAGSLLQQLIGHRNMLIEGPAGPWWAAFLVIATVAGQSGTPIEEVRGNIQGGLLIGGGLLFFAGIGGFIRRVQGLFTPRVTGVFLLLIAIQVSGLAVERMVSYGAALFFISLAVLVGSLLLLSFAGGMLKQSALLISVLGGWIAAALLGKITLTDLSTISLIALPDFLPWGAPRFDPATVLTLSVLGLLLVPNQIGSLRAMEAAKGEEIPPRRYDRGLATTGISCITAALFGGSGTTPFAISAGLVSITGEREKSGYILGALLFVLVGIFGPLAALMSSIPASVAGAVLLSSVSSLAVIGMRSLGSDSLEGREVLVVGLSILSGTGVMFVPGEIWSRVPQIVASLFSNGVITGTITILLLEHLVLAVGDKTKKEARKER